MLIVQNFFFLEGEYVQRKVNYYKYLQAQFARRQAIMELYFGIEIRI